MKNRKDADGLFEKLGFKKDVRRVEYPPGGKGMRRKGFDLIIYSRVRPGLTETVRFDFERKAMDYAGYRDGEMTGGKMSRDVRTAAELKIEELGWTK